MRHVSDEARSPRIAPDDFGPLVPRHGTPPREEEFEQLVRPLAPSEPHERADDAQLVRRVILPVPAAVAALDELLPVPLVRRGNRRLRQQRGRTRGRKGDRRRRGIEVAELRGSGNVGDAVPGHRLAQRHHEIAAKLGARAPELAHGAGLVQGRGDVHGGIVTLERPEVVPVRMHGLFRIALVTDRRRHHPVEGAPRRCQVGVGPLRLAQLFEIARGGRETRPERHQQRSIVGVAIHGRRQKQEFTRAVVLGDRIGAARVDAAGNLAADELMRRIPAQVVGGDVRMVRAQQRLRHHRAVPDPRARIRSRPRSQDRAVARDEDMRDGGPQRVDDRTTFRRHADRDAFELFAPLARRPCAARPPATPLRPAAPRRQHGRARPRYDNPDAARLPWSEYQTVREHPRRVARAILHLFCTRPFGRRQQSRRRRRPRRGTCPRDPAASARSPCGCRSPQRHRRPTRSSRSCSRRPAHSGTARAGLPGTAARRGPG